MSENGNAISTLLEELGKLPGIGPKTAERIAHFLLVGDRAVASTLADSLRAVVERVHPCRECHHLCEGERCEICSDRRRDAGMICVVETTRDVGLFERSGNYRGVYHVLGGRLAPLDNIGPDKLTLTDLLQRVRKGGVREVILATSPTLEGDGTALLVSTFLAGTGVPITRLARGVPSGASLELINFQILSDALDARKAY